jgi:hypothetical protein
LEPHQLTVMQSPRLTYTIYNCEPF